MTTRRLLKPGVLVATALAIVLLSAAPAFAHASFEGSEPGANSQVQTSPKAIVLRFSEPVTPERGGIKVFDSNEKAIDVGKYGRANGDSKTVSVPVPELQEGTYAVTWRVVSEDSHPIQGAFTFAVGDVAINSRTNDLAQELLSKEGGGNDVVGATYAVVRFLAFFGLAVFVGVCLFMVALFTEGWDSPRVRRLVWGGWIVAFVATALGICLQGAYSTGGGLGDALRPSVISDVIDTRFGNAWLARLVLLLLAIPLVLALQRTRARRGPLVVGGALLAIGRARVAVRHPPRARDVDVVRRPPRAVARSAPQRRRRRARTTARPLLGVRARIGRGDRADGQLPDAAPGRALEPVAEHRLRAAAAREARCVRRGARRRVRES